MLAHENSQPDLQSQCKTSILQLITGCYIFIIIFICPLKFGSVINNTGIGIYPLSVIEWAFSIWPPILTCLLSSIALFLSLISNKMNILGIFKRVWILIVPLFFLFCTSLVGIINSSELDYTMIFIWHVLGVLNFLFAVVIYVQNCPRSRNLFLAAVCIGTFLSIISGIYQIHFGFEETQNIALGLAKNDGRTLHPDMISRLNQKRAYAAFTYPNSYAAHLILTIPVLIAFIWKMSSNVQPSIVSQITFSGGLAILAIYCLLSTGSRGAVAALVLATLSMLIVGAKQLKVRFNNDKRILIAGPLFLIFLSFFLLITVFKHRDLLSLNARMDYYTAAVKLFLEHPVAGIGLGEFFPNYLRIKPPGAEETRLVHNLFLHFLSQCGLLGGAAALLLLVHPFIIWRSHKTKRLTCTVPRFYVAMLMGYSAWMVHSLTDFNIHITGSLFIAAILPVLCLNGKTKGKNDNETEKPMSISLCVLAIIGLSPINRITGEKAYQQLYNKQFKPIAAETLINEVQLISSKMPYSPYPWDILGEKALSQSKINLAIYAFEEAQKRTPHRASYYGLTAYCLLLKGSLPEALNHVNTALQWYPHKKAYLNLKKKIVEKLP